MGQRTLLPDGAEVVLDPLRVQDRDRIVMVLRRGGRDGSCPLCERRSDRIHSWYRRRLRDLPWEGIPVRIELRVRRFFRDSDSCPQRIFTERLPKTAPRYARRTSRLSFALEQITLALGGSGGARLAEPLGRHYGIGLDLAATAAAQDRRGIRVATRAWDRRLGLT